MGVIIGFIIINRSHTLSPLAWHLGSGRFHGLALVRGEFCSNLGNGMFGAASDRHRCLRHWASKTEPHSLEVLQPSSIRSSCESGPSPSSIW
jgi:hypothetical protein